MTAKRSQVPAGLSKPAQGWWKRLRDEYGIADVAGELLLETALRCFDRAEQARKAIDVDGPVSLDSRGRPKAHPAAAIERDSRSGMLAALRALNLDLEPLRDKAGRPPTGGIG